MREMRASSHARTHGRRDAGKMASRMVWRAALRTGPDLGLSSLRGFATAAALCRRAAPLGPMPNDDIDLSDPKSLKRYNSFTVYLKAAEAAKSKKCWWKTYRQYLKEENGNNDEFLVNIGLPGSQSSRSERAKERYRLVKENRHNPEMEKASRQLTCVYYLPLKIPVDRVQAEWECTAGPFQLRDVAMHYGVYRDLFPGAFFIPRVMLRVAYGNEATSHVHYGNHITPTEALTAPRVTFEADKGSLWTLLLTSPDEHLQDNEGEYVHWLVGNIPGNAVQSGEELCHYMPPFPVKGTGFHRFIFILFKQDKVINYEQHSRPSPCYSLKERTFKTLEFYKMHQDHMTPAGLAFFQCQWDESVTNTFHRLLNMKEPIFTFLRPPVYHPPQKVYPHRQPLRYLDRYRDGHVPTYGIY
ncbi:39S ribosomal protein L38, mitochondrial-like [Scleropages formosus]|uniref:Large ribosomal subunit protein mL38 n=1 Tax=Scleropages formosus TaxID=113540 RepID=A0A0P7WPG3_SCLFO|nr:39S ribosomal protein L38, mitochondrial-like [Scleropages formosus]